jgi:iron only hydrogenase large subunit-like protein
MSKKVRGDDRLKETQGEEESMLVEVEVMVVVGGCSGGGGSWE